MTDTAPPAPETRRPIPVGVCTRLVRVSDAHLQALFGKDRVLTELAQLPQPGQFAAAETIAVRGPKGTLPSIRVVGPLVEHTTVELTLRDRAEIGLDVEKGEAVNPDGCVLEGPKGTVVLASGVVTVRNRLVVSVADAGALGVSADKPPDIQVAGDRARVFHDVPVEITDGGALEFLLELDDANAVDLAPTTVAYLAHEESVPS